jgi:hypothetical protein
MEKQQLTNEFPNEPIEKSSTSPMEELRVYSRRQKSNILDAICQASDPNSGYTTYILDINYAIPIFDDMNLPTTQYKVRSCTSHICFLSAPFTIISFLCVQNVIYRRHSMIQSGGW